MSVDDDIANDSDRKKNRYHFDRHTPEYRGQFEKITEEIHDKCPVAWTDTYDGHWVAGGSNAVFELARCPVVSNDHDINGERRGYQGISIPKAKRASGVRGGILEMDEPEHRIYRTVLNPYLSPAAVKRWVPFIDITGLQSLEEAIVELHKRGVRVMLTGANARVEGKLEKAGIIELVGREHFFKTFAEAMQACRPI